MVSEHIFYRFALPDRDPPMMAVERRPGGLGTRSASDDDRLNRLDSARGCLPFSSPRPAAPGEPSRPIPPFAALGRLPLPICTARPA